MDIKRGITETLQKKSRIYAYKVKHFGEPKVMTVGISNFCSNFKWHLFYDYDYDLLLQDEALLCSMIGGNNTHVIHTKHGIQLLDLKCRELAEVKKWFDYLKTSIPSDYYWSSPLFLRISEKVDENGKIISPMTDIFNKIPKEILLNHFLDRKLYRTWD